MAPALDIAANMFLGRERRRAGPLGSIFRMLDKNGMKEDAGKSMANLGIATVQNMSQAVETLSGGQRQAVAVARAATFAQKFVVLDEPTAALGVKETGQVLNLIQQIKAKGMPVILISHNMPNVFEVVGPHPHRPPGRVRRRHHPEVAHADRGGGHHDGSHHAAARLTPSGQHPRLITRTGHRRQGVVVLLVVGDRFSVRRVRRVLRTATTPSTVEAYDHQGDAEVLCVEPVPVVVQHPDPVRVVAVVLHPDPAAAPAEARREDVAGTADVGAVGAPAYGNSTV